MNNRIIMFVGVSLLFLFIIGFNVYSHESVHEIIFSYDGCKDTSVHYGLSKSYTTCISDGSYNESEVAMLSHNFNEVVGYNVTTIILCALMICMTIILTSKMEE